MNSTPSSFIELSRRLLAGIRGIVTAIQEREESISPKPSHTEETANKQNNIPAEVRATVQIPGSVEVHKSTAETTTESNYQFWTLLISASSLGVAILTLISLIIYAYITHGQLIEMRKATKATQTSAKAAEKAANTAIANLRPWIKIQDVELGKGYGPIKTLMFHFPLTGAAIPPSLQIKVSMLNVGHSVAQDVDVWPELFFGTFQSDKWYEVVTREQERFCRSVIDKTPTGAARIVFPSDPTDWPVGLGGVVHDADIMHVPGNLNSYTAGSLIICVNYGGDGGLHYQAQARSSLYEDNQVLINIGLDADASRLRLIREPNGDHAN